MFKVGDKVVVKSYEQIYKEADRIRNDWGGNLPVKDEYIFIDSMKKYCGKEVTIRKIDEPSYEYKNYQYGIMEMDCTWCHDWFVVSNKRTRLFNDLISL